MIKNFIIAVISGTFLVFAVLVLLYRRFLPPFVNMGSLLLAPLGGLLALLVTGSALSMPVFIGLLMLLGIVAKNSILLLDFALAEMSKAVDLLTAIIVGGHKIGRGVARDIGVQYVLITGCAGKLKKKK